MITQLSLRNFQKHVKKDVHLDSLVTVLIGATDAGKSSIFRALRWLCLNRPLGDGFIRHGTKDAGVRIVVDDKKVTRRRGGKGNIYTLEGKTYKSFGGEVPSEIYTILNMGDVNFQRQHDPPFWFLLSPGEVSKELNKIVDLSLIDTTLTNLGAEVRKSKLVVEVSRERLESATSRRESLSWSAAADKELQELELKYTELTERRQKRRRMRLALEDAESLGLRHKNASKAVLGVGKAIQELETLRDRLEEIEKQRKTAQKYRDELCQRRDGLCQRKKELVGIEKELKEALKDQCPLCGTLHPSSPLPFLTFT